MKKILLVITAFWVSFFVNAQQVFNSDFEDWTSYDVNPPIGPPVSYDSLDGWTSSNDIANQTLPAVVPKNVFQETGVVSTGLSSARLRTVNCVPCGFIPDAPTTIPGTLLFEDAYTDRPESISFDYRYSPVGGDWAAALVLLQNSISGDTIAATIVTFEDAVGSWTNKTMPLTYFSGDNPDAISILFVSSVELFLADVLPDVPPAQVGSELYVDNLQFVMPTPGQASPVGLIVASDVADNGNGLDLQGQFAAAQDETTIGEYRVMCVKESDAPSFDLTAAELVTEYYPVSPIGGPIGGTFLSTSNDIDGDPIENDVPYRIFVMSLADGINATINNLSPMSNSVTLVAQRCDSAENISAMDVNDNDNGTDLEISFDPANDETTVSEYRIMIVKSAAAPTFNLAAAEGVSSGNYVSHAPDGAAYQSIQQASTNDVDGDLIQNNVPYKVFVLSIADGTITTLNNLSEPSDEITLSSTASLTRFENQLKLYPIPVKDLLHVDYSSQQAKTRIIDASGREVFSDIIFGSSTIDMSEFNSGLYFLKVEFLDETIIRKVVKE